MEIESIGKIIVAILVICWAVKKAGLNSKYVPILAIFLGVGGAFLFGGLEWANLLIGLIVGLGTTLGYRETKQALS